MGVLYTGSSGRGVAGDLRRMRRRRIEEGSLYVVAPGNRTRDKEIGVTLAGRASAIMFGGPATKLF